jgi:hypothetical protein
MPIRNGVFSGAKPPPRVLNHPPFAAGMNLVEQKFTRSYSLIRFRSAKPQMLQSNFLQSLRLDSRPVVVLYQR